jgi:aspartate aminotransferase-like enzyme
VLPGSEPAEAVKKKRVLSEESRKKMAEGQKKRWERYRKQKKAIRAAASA